MGGKINRLICAAALAVTSPATGKTLEQFADRSNPTVAVSKVDFRGKPAVRALDVTKTGSLDPLILLSGEPFRDGTIEAEVAGLPAAGAAEGSRGFIGIAFRVQRDRSRYEAFYIRPTNGRSDDQLRRNHSTQYIAMPEHPWQRLREEHPGVYESYADMAPGQWIELRIEVTGSTARLFVGGTDQPALIVNDLKLGVTEGAVALWIGPGTEGYFRNVTITRAD